MALVKSILQTELGTMFMEQPATGITPGRNITKAFKNYLSMAQNAAGFPYSVVMAEPYGMNIGQIFQGMLPVGMTIGQAVGAQLSAMSLTFMSSAQIGPPVAAPSHIPLLQMLFNAYAPSPMDFGRELGGIMADWSKTWVVSGIIPGTPPVPFSGPLS
jgi:hypothetical protein